MVRFINIQTMIACLMGLTIALVHPAQAQLSRERLEVYVQSDTLRLDISIDSLFSKRAVDAIESGMTTSIAIHFRLTDSGTPLFARSLIKRLEHDIWEGQYRQRYKLFPIFHGRSHLCHRPQNPGKSLYLCRKRRRSPHHWQYPPQRCRCCFWNWLSTL